MDYLDQLWITLPAISPDYSGVCSAMFDLGGVTVVHDASGCTGNYTGYDEPRWYGTESKVYCSGLREIDAVLGRDDKLIAHTIEAGKLTNPKIYTVVGSPVPMVIGSDMKGIAHELEELTGVPSFGFDTNGLKLYNYGISIAMEALIERFAKKSERKIHNGINILGTNAFDFANVGNERDLEEFLTKNGFHVVAKMMMGATVEQIQSLTMAEINLVVSESAYKSAKLLHKKYGIPYVVANPICDGLDVLDLLSKTLKDSQCRIMKDENASGSIARKVLILGEQVTGNSIRRELLRRKSDANVSVATMTGLCNELASASDKDLQSENQVRRLLGTGEYSVIVGDPLFKDVLECMGLENEITLIEIPHVALSSKIHWNRAVHFLGKEMDMIISQIINSI